MRLTKINALKVAITIILIFFIIVLAIFPDKYVSVTKDGIMLWAITVLPSLLPYFFLTALLTKTGVLTKITKVFTPITKLLFNLDGISAYAFFMSVLSGYPVGSKIVKDLYLESAISGGEAHRLSILCSTSGPLFIIGAVGVSMLQSKTAGFIIYISHVLSAIITTILFRKYGENGGASKFLPKTTNCDNFLYEAVYSSVISAIVVGGFVSVFYVLAQILIDFKVLTPFYYLLNPLLLKLGASGNEVSIAFTCGLIEFTKGCSMLSSMGCNPLTVSLCSFLITFSGASVIMQSLSFLGSANVKGAFFIACKVVSGIFAFLLCYLLCFIFL
ncbi:MAG: hypothetical protein IKL82_01535 [Clostridia bacterium]|nr:hypothetical protein [Clostridia bacterium]